VPFLGVKKWCRNPAGSLQWEKKRPAPCLPAGRPYSALSRSLETLSHPCRKPSVGKKSVLHPCGALSRSLETLSHPCSDPAYRQAGPLVGKFNFSEQLGNTTN